MKLQFDKNQSYQLEAIQSIVDLFEGQDLNKSDFEWAEHWAEKMNPSCKLYLQPEWDKAEKMTPLIVDYIKAHPKWGLSLQTHKYINVP